MRWSCQRNNQRSPKTLMRSRFFQLHAKLHGFAGLSPHNRAHKGLADADYSVLNAVGIVAIHVLLLLINLTNRLQSLRLMNFQCIFLIQLPVNGSKVSFLTEKVFPHSAIIKKPLPRPLGTQQRFLPSLGLFRPEYHEFFIPTRSFCLYLKQFCL